MVVAVYKPGDYVFPPVSFVVSDPTGKTSILSSSPVNIRIQSVLAGKNDELKTLKNQAVIPEPVRWVLWLAVALVLFLSAAVLWWWRKRRGKSSQSVPTQPRLDPLQLAESELRDLLSRGLLDKGLTKQFYVLLSDISKKMLEAGYGIQTVEKTSAEIMDELSTSGAGSIPEGETNRIHLLLLACDLVKFAKHQPSRPESDASVKLAFEVLDLCRKRRASLVNPVDAASVA